MAIFDIKKAEAGRTYSNVNHTPLQLGTLYQKHEPQGKDLVSASFSSKSLDTTRRGVPAAVAEMGRDRVLSADTNPASSIKMKATSIKQLRHPFTGKFVSKKR